jgi:DNA gyrase subunit B
MPELIEAGHLYIAQPPLFKVTRGKSVRYCKDQRELEDYLVQEGIEGTTLRLASGTEIAGQDLLRLVEQARRLRQVLAKFPTSYPRFLLEQAAIEGAMNPDLLERPEGARQTAERIAERLDRLAPETERGWEGGLTADGGYVFTRTVRGVSETRTLDAFALRSAEARTLAQMSAELHETYDRPSELLRKDRVVAIRAPSELLDTIMAEGEKGVTLQRYKGLGEMNADQLWETTLDPEARTLLQVRIDEITEADEIFTKLMGDVVEPRRQFIQDNALSVENLDI